MTTPDLQKAVLELIGTVEATGGVFRMDDGQYAPVGDPGWIDLGASYVRLCEAMSLPPKINDDPSDPEFMGEEDWRLEVANGDTVLGFAEWREHQAEAERIDDYSPENTEDISHKHDYFSQPSDDLAGALTAGTPATPQDMAQVASERLRRAAEIAAVANVPLIVGGDPFPMWMHAVREVVADTRLATDDPLFEGPAVHVHVVRSHHAWGGPWESTATIMERVRDAIGYSRATPGGFPGRTHEAAVFLANACSRIPLDARQTESAAVVARAVASLAGSRSVRPEHVAEALTYRKPRPRVDTGRVYAIRSEGLTDDTGQTPLWWSNDDGWGSRETATLFTAEQKASFNLPAPAESSRWVQVARLPA